jgi:hypothetical protein
MKLNDCCLHHKHIYKHSLAGYLSFRIFLPNNDNSFEINVYIVISFALLISALPTQLLTNITPSTAFTIGTLMPTDTSSVARSARLFT